MHILDTFISAADKSITVDMVTVGHSPYIYMTYNL